MVRLLLILVWVCLSWMINPAVALAHGVLTDYRLVSDALEIQATFSTGEAFEGAGVLIYAPNNPDQPWLQGKTDQSGKFAFQPDRALTGEWSVRIGQGDHGDILAVPVSNAGIDLDAISQSPYDGLHRFTKQAVVTGVLLSSLGASRLLRWKW